MRQWLMGVVVGALVGGLVGALVVLLVVPSRAGAAPEGQTQTIRDLVVQRLRVVDVAGDTRGVFEVRGNDAVLGLYAPSGWERVTLAVNDEHAGVQVTDPSESGTSHSRIALLDVGADRAILNLKDITLGDVGLGVTSGLGPGYAVRDRDSNWLWHAP